MRRHPSIKPCRHVGRVSRMPLLVLFFIICLAVTPAHAHHSPPPAPASIASLDVSPTPDILPTPVPIGEDPPPSETPTPLPTAPCYRAAMAALTRQGAIYSQGGALPNDPIDPKTNRPYPRSGPN